MYWKQDFLDGKVQLKAEDKNKWNKIMQIVSTWDIIPFISYNGTHHYVKIHNGKALQRGRFPFCNIKIIEPKFIQNIE